MDISIIIVSWNAKRFLLECLQSLGNGTLSHSTELIVVDNGSTDGSQDLIRQKFPHVKLICNDTNLGFAKANNIGIKESIGRYVCLVNSDVKVLEGCLDRLCNYMDQHRSIGIIGPKILWPDMTLQDSCRKFPTLWNNFCLSIGLQKAFPQSELFSGEHMVYFPHDRICTVDSLVGCFLMVRREAIDQVGLLDERFFIYSEEVDWCKRLWNSGWEVVFFPGAQVIHYGRGSSSNAPLRFILEQKRSILQYWRIHHGWLSQIAILSIFLFHHIGRMISGSFSYLIKPSKRAEVAQQIANDLACIRFLLSLEKSRQSAIRNNK
jgi:hypothetical protein